LQVDLQRGAARVGASADLSKKGFFQGKQIKVSHVLLFQMAELAHFEPLMGRQEKQPRFGGDSPWRACPTAAMKFCRGRR
jgi:hypothetical protein